LGVFSRVNNEGCYYKIEEQQLGVVMNVDEILEFIAESGGENYRKMPADEIIDAIEKHIEYRTILTVRDKKGIWGIARWNWVNEEEVDILDVIIRKDRRSIRAIKYLVYLGFKNNPSARYMKYKRDIKYPNKEKRKMLIGGKYGKHKHIKTNTASSTNNG